MEVFDYAYVNNNEAEGRTFRVLMTKEEAQMTLNVGLDYLLQSGLAQVTENANGVSIRDLMEETGGNA